MRNLTLILFSLTACGPSRSALQEQINAVRLENTRLDAELEARATDFVQASVRRDAEARQLRERLARNEADIASMSAEIDRLDLRTTHSRAVASLVLLSGANGVTEDGRVTYNKGSGWVARGRSGRKVIVTNRHVVSNWVGQRGVACFFPGESRGDCTEAHVAFIATQSDLAIVYVAFRGAHDRIPPLSLGEGVRYGDPVVISGHPQEMRFQATRGVITGIHNLPGSGTCGGQACYVADAYSLNGMSGGPVLNSQGLVIGMIFGIMYSDTTLRIGSSFSVIVPSAVIGQILDQI